MNIDATASLLAPLCNLKPIDTRKVVRAYLNLIEETIAKDGEVEIPFIGTVLVLTKNAHQKSQVKRDGHQEVRRQPAMNLITFRASDRLKRIARSLPKIYKRKIGKTARKHLRRGTTVFSVTIGDRLAQKPRESRYEISQILAVKEEFRGDLIGSACFVNRILPGDQLEVGTLDDNGEKVFKVYREDQLTAMVYRDNMAVSVP